MDDNNDGFWGGLLGGLLGPSPQQLAALRQKYGVPDAEVPSVAARMGRGLMDLIEPAKQTYLNLTNPNAAAVYQQQRMENERLYEQGILAGDPQGYQPTQIATLPNGEPLRISAPSPKDADIWRMIGRTTPFGVAAGMFAPIGTVATSAAPLAQSAFDFMATTGIYNGLDTLRRQFGLAPWLDMPQFWQ